MSAVWVILACAGYGATCYAVGYVTGYAVRSTYSQTTDTEGRKP